jgi:hypothetical protein
MSERIGQTKGEFSVCIWYDTGQYEYVRRWVSAEEAVTAAKHHTTSVGARLGVVTKVIVTDGLDLTNFEWDYKKGIVFPTPEMLQQARDALKGKPANDC